MWFFGLRRNELEQENRSEPGRASTAAIPSPFTRPRTVRAEDAHRTWDGRYNGQKMNLVTRGDQAGLASLADNVLSPASELEPAALSAVVRWSTSDTKPDETSALPIDGDYPMGDPVSAIKGLHHDYKEGVPIQESSSRSDELAMFFACGPRWLINLEVPREQFDSLRSATTDEKREISRSNFYQAVCSYIERIGSAEGRLSTGFADFLMVVLIPDTEMLVELSRFDRSIFEVAGEKGVVIATPESLVTVIERMIKGPAVYGS